MNPKEIDKVYCLFEQSGTFKNVLKKNFGIENVFDFDLKNEFGQTDFKIDLFEQINQEFNNIITHTHTHTHTIFSELTRNSLCFAFFPCIYFTTVKATYFQLTNYNYRTMTNPQMAMCVLENIHKRAFFHEMIYKLYFIFKIKGLRLIIENPATQPHYLFQQNFPKPTFIDNNRALRGDFFKKPTAYWFINVKLTHGETIQKNVNLKKVEKLHASAKAGECSTERSLISQDYARNFCNDFIFGDLLQQQQQLNLF